MLASMTATRGNQIKAAELLGLNRNTLRKKIRELGVNVYRASKPPDRSENYSRHSLGMLHNRHNALHTCNAMHMAPVADGDRLTNAHLAGLAPQTDHAEGRRLLVPGRHALDRRAH